MSDACSQSPINGIYAEQSMDGPLLLIPVQNLRPEVAAEAKAIAQSGFVPFVPNYHSQPAKHITLDDLGQKPRQDVSIMAEARGVVCSSR